MTSAYDVALEAVEEFFEETGECSGHSLAFDMVRNKKAYDMAWEVWLECQPGSGIPDFSMIEEHVHIMLLKGV